MSKKSASLARKTDLPETARQMRIIVAPKTEEQRTLLKTISENTITFVCGHPGTGKTYLAIAYALQQLFRGKYEQIIVTRPVVEAAGERLGFLPGDVQEKIDPYMMPIYNFLFKMADEDVLKKLLSKNGKPAVIQICPLAYMRGATFDNSIILCDEAQNSTPEQMRMLLTRIGEGSKMIVSGDVNQSDIKYIHGLEDAFSLLPGIQSIGFVTLTEDSVVRNPIIRDIESRYQKRAETERAEAKSRRLLRVGT